MYYLVIFQATINRIKKLIYERIEKNIVAYKKPSGKNHRQHKPHIRSAHWHGYWTGKRGSAARRFILKWLPTTIIKINGRLN
jgi:hypothetical protein